MSKILYEKRGAIGVLGLNRPEKLNAIDAEMLEAIDSALVEAADDDDVKVLVLYGNGKAFSAGFDIDIGEPPEGTSNDDHVRAELRRGFDLIMKMWDFPKPVIASVHGYCLGSAMELTAVCDVTIASDDSLFGAPEVQFGSGIMCMILPWIVGQKNARELLLTGARNIDAMRAERIGLINRIVPVADLQEETRQMANDIAGNDSFAVRMTKRALNQSMEIAGMRRALEQAFDIDMQIETTDTPESVEFNRIMNEQGLKAALKWRASDKL